MSLTITVKDQKVNISKSFTVGITEDPIFISTEIHEYLKKVYGAENVKETVI